MVKKLLILSLVIISVTAYGQGNRFAGFGQRNCDCDTSAQRFIDSTGVTDAVTKNAICCLVKRLKDSSLWNKLYAAYPMRGGTATSCKFNLINPTSTSTFNLTFSGGWTFSSTGALPNGTNGYADTHINSSTNLISNSTHMSYYSTTNNNVATVGISLTNYLLLFVHKNNASYFGVYTSPLRGAHVYPNISGLWIVSRVNGTEFFSYNGLFGYNNLYTSETPKPRENGNIYLAARNDASGVSLFSDQNCNFATIGAGLTVAECSTLTTIITQFYTDLGQ
jgi:hypothetical protein